MSRHTSYRGTAIDMNTLRRENEKTIALGNMGVNARGDKVENGVITKTADELARENHRIPTAILRTTLKPPIEQQESIQEVSKTESPKDIKKSPKREKELPNGDIVEE